ncbi:MAG: HAMP domain-containing histidine kinase [Lachnospiraceae bacterium]|nr:HAMP domain-containing histidine kinase [Lachnospiraceae bacterium]
MKEEEDERIKQLLSENEEFAAAISQIKEDNQLAISKMSHEIRNMITLVKSSLQIIETRHPEVKDFALWEQIGEDLNTTNEMLMQYSTYNNLLKVNKKSGDIITLIENTAESFRPQCEQRGIGLFVSIAAEARKYASHYEFDKIRMKQALINLIKNAMEACSRNDEITVSLSLDHEKLADSPSLLLQVSDNGYSINKEIMKKLFEPYFTTKDTGTGLGLSIVKKIIYSHGGDISVESDDAVTKVSCYLPTKQHA